MRILSAMFALLLLTACATPAELEKTPDPIGDFKLGFAVAVTSPNVTKGPISREATSEEWNSAMKTALENRLKRYKGDVFYHVAIVVEGYVLAQPGIPVLLSPKSVLIFNVTVIEDATQMTLTTEPHQLTVSEQLSPATIISSGLTQSKEQQLENLGFSAARSVENWMREQPWFYDTVPSAALVTADEGTAPAFIDVTSSPLAPEASEISDSNE